MNYYHVFFNTSTFEVKKYAVATPTCIVKEFKTEASAIRYAKKLNAKRAARAA